MPLIGRLLDSRRITPSRRTEFSMAEATENKQLLHLVFGGELKSLTGNEFRDTEGLDIVGIFPDYQSAVRAWRAKAQETVDNAHMRYFIVHLHRLLEPAGSPSKA
jgi:hypothetical protein